jgi:hypothetical protein|tara:strand:- start:1400 stop:1867 length:468 start_codon:yes stop_codon:yes gene_type:complete
MKRWIARIAYTICQAWGQEPEQIIYPTKTVKADSDEIYRILREEFPNGQIYISDSTDYFLCAYDDIAYFLAKDETNRQEYVEERFDCDDFAAMLYGQFSTPDWSDMCVGLIWTERHALNIMISVDKRVLFIEPQSDTIQENLLPWQGQAMRFIIM